MNVQDILDDVQLLAPQEREELLRKLEQLMAEASTEVQQKKHTLMELAGLGEELWEGVDAQAYVNELRNEWDHRA